MERSVALKKLTKLIGKNVAYRIDPKAPDRDEREEAHLKSREASAKREELRKLRDARRDEILAADAEYQRLQAECVEADKVHGGWFAEANRYRITVGHHSNLFFMVKAQGDTWEEIFAKLTKERERT